MQKRDVWNLLIMVLLVALILISTSTVGIVSIVSAGHDNEATDSAEPSTGTSAENRTASTGDAIRTSTGYAIKDDFEVNTLLMKVATIQGKAVEREIKVNAISGGEFSLAVIGLNAVSLSENNFDLQAGNEKKITVKFDSSELDTGVYVGSVKITSQKNAVSIPIVFEVESQGIFFDTNLEIPPQYSEVLPGEKIVALAKIFDLRESIGAATVDTEYYIKDIEGNTLVSETENIAISGQTQITKTLSLPKSMKKGDYVFVSIARYKSSFGSSTRFFRVVDKKSSALSIGSFDFTFTSILVFILIIFFGVIFLVLHLTRERDKLILELRKYNDWEMQREKNVIARQEKTARKKGKKHYTVFKKKAERKIKKLKQKHEKRLRQFKKLKEKGATREMLKMMKQWKKSGYNTLALEAKIKSHTATPAEMKKQLAQWRRKGYG